MRRTKAKAAETRDAILDAAEQVFHRQGVSGTSLAEIASAAGVTRGAIYWHFANKADVFRAMTERVSAPEEDFFLERTGHSSAETLAGLKLLLNEMIRRFVADKRAQRVHEIVLFRCEYVGEMGDALNGRRQKEEAFEAAVREVFARAISRNEVGDGWTPELASAALRCAVLGSIADWLRFERSFDLPEVCAALLDSLFYGLATNRSGIGEANRRSGPAPSP